MNCFYHQEKPAIGLCKCCNKGLCFECAVDLDFGLACKNKHEKEVEAIEFITQKSQKIFTSAPKNSLIAPIFYLFMGFVFAGFGFYSKGGVTDLPFVLGIGFIIFGIITFIRGRAIYAKSEKA